MAFIKIISDPVSGINVSKQLVAKLYTSDFRPTDDIHSCKILHSSDIVSRVVELNSNQHNFVKYFNTITSINLNNSIIGSYPNRNCLNSPSTIFHIIDLILIVFDLISWYIFEENDLSPG